MGIIICDVTGNRELARQNLPNFGFGFEAGDRRARWLCPMLKLAAIDCHWIKPDDAPLDLCAHGAVELTIVGHTFSTTENGDWCVSAAAVHLLRTLTRSHTRESPLAGHLIPHCGHTMIPSDAKDEDVLIIGCDEGMDWQVTHQADSSLLFDLPDGDSVSVPLREWRDAVVEFADTVRDFYRRSAAKSNHNKRAFDGYRLMIREWDRRRTHAKTIEC